VKHAIVCGHSDCGALKAALDRKSLENLPKARRWLDHIQAAFAYKQPLNLADGESAELAALIRGNVVAQLKNLQAQVPVRCAVEEGRLTVHGWYYDILTGRIEEYDQEQKRFAVLAN
jgi:carbonic anhydrase